MVNHNYHIRLSTEINEYIIFFIAFAFLTLLVTSTVNTGDSGELITSAHFLGIAHPSGYPLYLLLAKAFSLIPFGNIAFRIALLSVITSSFSLVLLYRIVYKVTDNKLAGYFSVVFLLGSYSYITQSVITKFYPLNLLLICIITLLWIEIILDRQNLTLSHDKNTSYIIRKKLILIAFLLGIISSNHHTGLIILGPIILLSIFKRHNIFPKQYPLKTTQTVIQTMLAFVFGFSINLYLIFRGGDQPFSNIFHIYSFEDFLMHISRGAYGGESTLTLATNLFSDFINSMFYGIKNFLEAINKNFGIATLIIFIIGAKFLYKKYNTIFIFSLLALIFYGPLLTKVRLPSEDINAINYYIVVHQYFMPALWFYAFFLGNGIAGVIQFLDTKTNINIKPILVSFCFIFVCIFALQRLNDSNYRTNYVAYQSAKDALSILPAQSLYFSIGDNEKFTSRYLTTIGQYRNDVCQLNGVILQKKVTGLDSCANYSFSTISPEKMKMEWEHFIVAARNGRLYTDYIPPKQFPLASTLTPFQFGPLISWSASSERSLESHKMVDTRLLSPFICEEHMTIDIFTDHLCSKQGYKMVTKLTK